MKSTQAKKIFKKRFGQANHFLITALVGIDAIKNGTVTKKPDSFRTIWEPGNIQRSADRTRIFILKSFLGWAVESLEMYMSEIYRKPKLIESPIIESLYTKAGQSIYNKVIFLGDAMKIDPVLVALMEVLITWRNYTFHYDIDNEIREISQKCLISNAEIIKERFSGLIVTDLENQWKSGADFTFKETASLIKATQDFVTAVDIYLIGFLNIKRYYIEAIEKHFKKTPISKIHYISFSPQKKEKFLRVLLQNIVGVTELKDSLIKEVIHHFAILAQKK